MIRNLRFWRPLFFPFELLSLKILPEGFEPSVRGLEVRCSNPLCYGNISISYSFFCYDQIIYPCFKKDAESKKIIDTGKDIPSEPFVYIRFISHSKGLLQLFSAVSFFFRYLFYIFPCQHRIDYWNIHIFLHFYTQKTVSQN